MTSNGERCDSTWQGPSCASSSSTNTTVFRQYRERDRASIMRPSARSLFATYARGGGAAAGRAGRRLLLAPAGRGGGARGRAAEGCLFGSYERGGAGNDPGAACFPTSAIQC